MKRFVFPLDRVLEWRRLVAEEAEAKLQRLLADEQILLSAQQELARQAGESEAAVRSAHSLAGEDFRTLSAHAMHLRSRAAAISGRLTALQQQTAAQRRECLEARRQRELLEELRTRQLARWRQDQDAELEVIAQESFLSAWSRKRSRAQEP